jgi:hypothetical protein
MLLSLTVPLIPVHAQSTSITDLSHPPATAQDSLDPITITATITYNDAGPGYTLAVGIVDMDASPPSVVPGVATSSPDGCVNQPVLSALCFSKPTGTSGMERVEFRIGGILGGNFAVDNWNLNMTAVLYDSDSRLVANSASSVSFRIGVSPMTLYVIMPPKAAAWVDGVQQQEGPVQVHVRAGTHNVTVPSIVDIDQGTRLRFDHWKDGLTEPSRTVTMDLSATVEAIYVAQYKLTIVGHAASTMGEGWYDAGYVATFSTAETEQMSGFLGVLGGRQTFQGWYENNTLVSNSTVDILIMNGPHTLTLVSQGDYTMPIIILGTIIAIFLVLSVVMLRRRNIGPTKERGATVRRRSPRRTSSGRKANDRAFRSQFTGSDPTLRHQGTRQRDTPRTNQHQGRSTGFQSG